MHINKEDKYRDIDVSRNRLIEYKNNKLINIINQKQNKLCVKFMLFWQQR